MLSPRVDFSTRVTGDRTSYVAHHADLGKYFRFGAEEYHVAALIDGTRDVSEIHSQLLTDGIGWSPEELVEFIGKLSQHKILVPRAPGADPASANVTGEPATGAGPLPESPESSAANRDAAATSQSDSKALLQSFTAALSMLISQRIPLLNGQRIAAKFESSFGRFFSAPGMAVWFVLVTSAMLVVYGHRDAFHSEVRKMFDPGIWPILIGIWLVAKVVHEIGHAVAAHRLGVRVGPMGIMFFLFAPLAYVDVTDAWKLRSRMRRVQIALAGVYLELAIASVAAWAWWLLPSGLLRHLSAQVFLVAGPATLLVNANPLLRLDGYYVLSDLLEIPNLRMHGRKQLGGHLERWLIGIKPPQSLLSGWRRGAATAHATGSVVFQFFWMAGLILAVSMWAQGLGILLGAAAVLLWGILPLSRWAYKIWILDPPERFGLNDKRKRLISIASFLLLAMQYFTSTSSPLDRRVPVVVRFHDEQIARAATDAFVDAVHVRHGQRVEKGQLLIELNQPELILEHQAMLDELELARQRSNQSRRQGNIALADAKTQEAESIQRRIDEHNKQVDRLSILAERDGLVTTSNLQRLIGRYVRQGEELIRVADPTEKELLTAVGERDVKAYRLAAESHRKATVRLRGGMKIKTVPVPLRPRARVDLPHPAMSALVGGPLAVEPSDHPDRPVQLVEPQLQSVTPLDPLTSAMVSAGQLGSMTIADDRALLARVYEALKPSTR
tara:strand:- start:545200 stop:547380 length:2181 start_codon:yes stop_codon:yes gene_type:complete